MAPFGRFVIIGWLLSEVHETQVRSVHHSEPHVWTKRKKERAAGPLFFPFRQLVSSLNRTPSADANLSVFVMPPNGEATFNATSFNLHLSTVTNHSFAISSSSTG
jgi:hypothetical protein